MPDPIERLEEEFIAHVKEDAVWKARHEENHAQQEAMVKEILQLQKENSVQIKENTTQIGTTSKSVDQLTKDTSGIISLYQNVNGAMNTAKGLQKFFLWCVKWGIVTTAFATMLTYLMNQGPKV